MIFLKFVTSNEFEDGFYVIYFSGWVGTEGPLVEHILSLISAGSSEYQAKKLYAAEIPMTTAYLCYTLYGWT